MSLDKGVPEAEQGQWALLLLDNIPLLEAIEEGEPASVRFDGE